jgi:hypothetical protein
MFLLRLFARVLVAIHQELQVGTHAIKLCLCLPLIRIQKLINCEFSQRLEFTARNAAETQESETG